MITAALLVLGVVTALLCGLLVAVTVLFSRALDHSLAHADSIHARSQGTIDGLADRLMAADLAEFKSYKLAEDAPEGGQDL